MEVEVEKKHLPRSLSLYSGAMLNVGAHIGAGIFLVQGIIFNEVGSVGMVIILFVIGGVVSMFGACAYVELGCMLPISGISYVLIRQVGPRNI